MGSGGLFFDYDNDGWIDVFLVDGGSLADPQVARPRAPPAVSESTERHVRGRDGEGRASVTASTAWAPAPPTTTTTASTISTSPTWARTSCITTTATGRSPTSRRTPESGLPLWSTSCAFADFDNDGRRRSLRHELRRRVGRQQQVLRRSDTALARPTAIR